MYHQCGDGFLSTFMIILAAGNISTEAQKYLLIQLIQIRRQGL